jgi:sulfoxide reductase heme-binding subunit YedZ
MLKFFIWILAALPGIDLFFLILLEKLGSNPQEAILRYLGTWTLVILILTFSLPVLVKFSGNEILKCRRMLGLWTFFYGTLHFLSFLIFENELLLSAFIKDLVSRPFVTVGFSAFLLLVPLVLTSNKFSMVFLGVYWKKIHWLIYPIILLSVVHFFLHKTGKSDFMEPAITFAVVIVIIFLKKTALRK